MPKKIPSNYNNRSRYRNENSNSNPNSNNTNNVSNSSNGSVNTSNDSGNTSSKLCCFGYVDYIVLASTLAIALGEELDNTDLSILSTFFAVLSDELALITSVNSCSNNTPDETFVAPVPDVAMTSDYKNLNVHNKKNRTRIKKIIKKKVKKK
ncbi:hypothetical protein EAI30_09425 [Romboutsia ilealis]|uniref:Uncharacterized protein n=1 Tax=Romboutsia faecis TaxID=2764597 RepID=A0ABR7JRJ1_9FIRM|nr:hypothetical protein [Romboutsia faecis]MBC5997532.1 hypothetical protein [Romboutsia faecis]MRN24835.1 hypothetical protein [Romboutsia ilealis]